MAWWPTCSKSSPNLSSHCEHAMKFSGKVAVITGAGRGIGECFAHELAREGAAVALLDTDIEAAQEVCDKLVAEGCSAIALRCDVADEHAFDAAAAETAQRLGGI